MTRDQQAPRKKWVEKLIRFFRQMPRKKPDAGKADYSGWHQSEDQYQKQQAECIRLLKARKQQKRPDDEKTRE